MGNRRSSRRAQRSWLGLVCALVALAALAPAARADFGIESLTTTVSDTQAGGHPDFSTLVTFNLLGDGSPDGRVKDLTVSTPPGLLGNPQAVPTCPMAMLMSSNTCPPDTQIGTTTLTFDNNFS